jgi:DNA-binding MarR family transcriptional regulator
MLDPNLNPQKLNLAQLLVDVSRLVGGRMRRKMESLGLQRAQGLILVQLWHGDGIAQNELARSMLIRPATVTTTLQRMERDGWIRRCRDEADQRIVRVHLTKKAGALREEISSCFRELDADMTEVLASEELTELHRLLLKVHRHLAPGKAIGRRKLSDRSTTHWADREEAR